MKNTANKLGVAAFAGLLAVGTMTAQTSFANDMQSNKCSTMQKSSCNGMNEAHMKDSVNDCRSYHEPRTSNGPTESSRKTGVTILEDEAKHGDAQFNYMGRAGQHSE